jgi:KamA family protein
MPATVDRPVVRPGSRLRLPGGLAADGSAPAHEDRGDRAAADVAVVSQLRRIAPLVLPLAARMPTMGVMSLALHDALPTGLTGRYRALGPAQLGSIASRYGLSDDEAHAIRLHAMVLPFRVNEYVLDNLIDWADVPADPMYQLVFPQPGMLPQTELAELARQAGAQGSTDGLRAAVAAMRARLNPHPAGQRELNVPHVDGQPVPGLQHKYARTVLHFPAQGQTCHAYCTYCFRWAQFVGDQDLRFAATDPSGLIDYLAVHPEVTDVLVTGGDPMIMSTMRLRGHLEPILSAEAVDTIRIGTKSLAYWPARFTSDPDADDLLRLMEKVVASGRTLAVMAHFSHPRELSTDLVQEAVARIRSTGAAIYCQAPLMAHVNDDADAWARLWRAELAVGAVPYYMFLARDTGPQAYFEVPLDRAWRIFSDAYATLPGLARTVRGPVMSSTPGKVVVDGAGPDCGAGADSGAGAELSLRFLQARDPGLVGRPFRARMSTPRSAWLDAVEVAPGTQDDIRAAVTSARHDA